MRLKFSLMFLLVLGLLFAGCKDENNPAAPGGTNTTVYTGIVAGGGISGSITINVPVPKRAYAAPSAEGDTVAITGTLKIDGGASIPLTGLYVVSTGDFSLSGGGYTFTGFAGEGNITGSFSGPGGTGIFTAEAGTGGAVKSYCGTYQDNPPGTESGVFNMVINGTDILVIISPAGNDAGTFVTYGFLAGTEISIYDPENATTPVATGMLNTTNNTVSGVYANGSTGGTWTGALCN